MNWGDGQKRAFIAAQYLSAGMGGICRLARLTAKAMLDFGFEMRAFAAEDKTEITDLCMPVRSFGGERLPFLLSCQWASVFHGRGIYDFAGTARVNLRFNKLGQPYAVWINGIEVWEEFRRSRQRSLIGAHSLFANSDFTKNRALALHGDMFARARVCWLGTQDDDPGEVSPLRANGPPTCLIVARMERGRDKGHEALISSWSRVVSVVPDARLVIAGTGGQYEYFRGKAAASSAAGNIDFLGFVSEADLARLYAETTVFAMPSWGEGFGLVYIEAMRHRLPVIVSTHDAGQEINEDGVSGYNIDMRRPDELAERLIALLKDRALADRLGQQAFERWRTHFCYSRFRDRFRPLAMEFMRS